MAPFFPSLRRAVGIVGIALGLCTVWITPSAQAQTLMGFEDDTRQRATEAIIDASVDTTNLRRWMAFMTNAPQHAGSEKALENAEFVAGLFREWGYEAEIVRYDVLLPWPTVRKVSMLSPEPFDLALTEKPVAGDASSQRIGETLPSFNAFSADGDVTGELVYVNQGLPADYADLAARGISVEGKIVIARYGGSWRGIKPKLAAEHGAIACILYSDPRDDGYVQGPVYPEGPYKPDHGTQRGSVMDMPVQPGDPLTPDGAATEDAERLDIAAAPTIMPIPVLPISYADAAPLLENLGGETVPPRWRGGLPFTYRFGPGPAVVRVHLEFDWAIRPAYNVIARWEGSELPDEWVMRGNHRDAWAFGAMDPTSGHVAMMEEARAIAEAACAGFPPRRTVMFGSWDAEEQGLIGSTEWVEDHLEELREHLVIYINTDSNGRGFLSMGGSHSLELFINEVADDVQDPRATDATLLDRLRARDLVRNAGTPLDGPLSIAPLGSGSDYTPFLQHLGSAALNLGFGGEGGGGAYHSLFDTYEHYTRFGDPGFLYGATLAKVTGRVTTRLANADVLPFRYVPLAEKVATYVAEIKALHESMQRETVRHNALVAQGTYALAADPLAGLAAETALGDVPNLDFSMLDGAVSTLMAAAQEADRDPQGNFRIEHLLTDPQGLPGRPWFRNQIYAPGLYTGYGVKTLPTVRESVEQRAWEDAQRHIGALAGLIENLARSM
ncbi:MAG: M28 family peptidase [Bacteroidetes bacterium]|nr:M28 family peptidase [Bacteroidota bacterium]